MIENLRSGSLEELLAEYPNARHAVEMTEQVLTDYPDLFDDVRNEVKNVEELAALIKLGIALGLQTWQEKRDENRLRLASRALPEIDTEDYRKYLRAKLGQV